jgi:hypothetical protein
VNDAFGFEVRSIFVEEIIDLIVVDRGLIKRVGDLGQAALTAAVSAATAAMMKHYGM